MFWGLKLHFSSIEYSVLTYGTNTKSAQAKFDTLSQEQRFRFEWLVGRYPGTQDLVYACIGCEFDFVSVQFGNKEDVIDSYFKFKGRRESLTYTIKSDIKKHETLDFIPIDKLIFKYFIGEISPEYAILLCRETDDLIKLYDAPNLSWAKDKILKLIKYADFFNTTKYIHLLDQPS